MLLNSGFINFLLSLTNKSSLYITRINDRTDIRPISYDIPSSDSNNIITIFSEYMDNIIQAKNIFR
jgi:hypothetical protein